MYFSQRILISSFDLAVLQLTRISKCTATRNMIRWYRSCCTLIHTEICIFLSNFRANVAISSHLLNVCFVSLLPQEFIVSSVHRRAFSIEHWRLFVNALSLISNVPWHSWLGHLLVLFLMISAFVHFFQSKCNYMQSSWCYYLFLFSNFCDCIHTANNQDRTTNSMTPIAYYWFCLVLMILLVLFCMMQLVWCSCHLQFSSTFNKESIIREGISWEMSQLRRPSSSNMYVAPIVSRVAHSVFLA